MIAAIMKILAADTTTSINTVALCDDAHVLAETIVDCPRAHTKRLVETVHWVLGQGGAAFDDLDALAVSVGPGSFTGLRVGVAAFKGFALGTGLPLVGVPTLDAMSRLGPFDRVCPLLDAKMSEVFAAAYVFEGGERKALLENYLGPIDDLLDHLDGPFTFLGDGASVYRAPILERRPRAVFAPPTCNGPRASAVAAEAHAMIESGHVADAEAVTPVYLRKSQAEQARERSAAP